MAKKLGSSKLCLSCGRLRFNPYYNIDAIKCDSCGFIVDKKFYLLNEGLSDLEFKMAVANLALHYWYEIHLHEFLIEMRSTPTVWPYFEWPIPPI